MRPQTRLPFEPHPVYHVHQSSDQATGTDEGWTSQSARPLRRRHLQHRSQQPPVCKRRSATSRLARHSSAHATHRAHVLPERENAHRRGLLPLFNAPMHKSDCTLDDRFVRRDQQGSHLFSTRTSVDATEIPIVDSYKYLGLHIGKNLDVTNMANKRRDGHTYRYRQLYKPVPQPPRYERSQATCNAH